MGDLILITPLLRAIRRRHPRAHLTLVTRTEYAPLFSHDPRITELVTWSSDTPLHRLARQLRRQRWSHRLDLHGSLRSRTLRFMVGGRWRGYPKHRVARELLIRTKRDLYRDRRHVVERYFDAARGLDVQPDGEPPDIFLQRDELMRAERFLREYGLGQDRGLVALIPGAAHPTKQWPERHWHQLVRLLVAAGRDLVIVGGRSEQEIGARLAETAGGRAANAAGLFDLQGTAALLKQARSAIGGDTGASHLATAVGTPVVVMLGPTVPAFGFLPYSSRARVLERDLPCRPCSRMGGAACPLGHHDCLVGLTPDTAFEALRSLPR